MRLACTLFLAVFLATMSGHPARAAMDDFSCDERTRMTERLTQILGAERQGTGLRDPDTMLEIWVTQRSGDWFVVQNYANGTSCIVAMGEHWQPAARTPA